MKKSRKLELILTVVVAVIIIACAIVYFKGKGNNNTVENTTTVETTTVQETTKEKGIEVKNQVYIDEAYEDIYSNELLVKIINKFFNNEKMLMIFPRLTVEDSNGNIIRVSELYPELRTYYCKFGGEEK